MGEACVGSDFFDWTIINPEERSFTSAIMLFKNTTAIRELWDKIKAHISDYKSKYSKLPPFADQTFIVYNARMHGKFNNIKLNKYGSNVTYGNDEPTITSDQLLKLIGKDLIIAHHPCYREYKINAMNRTWNLIKPINIIDKN
jgi:hypothetical protein